MAAGDTLDLSGQVALVTAGGAGIGRGIALALARHGASVVVVDIDRDRAAATVADAESAGAPALAVMADVMDTEQVRSAVARAEAQFGRLDIVVNNAGGVRARPFLEQSERSWRRHIDLNLVSLLATTSAAVPLVIRGGRGGSILNVASIEASRAAPGYAVYAACKAAMVSFTRTMAVELSKHRIRVNVLTPDCIHTPGTAGLASGPEPDPLPARPREFSDHIAAYVPLAREGTADEVGAVAVFLCSAMAGYVTGAVVPVDGGTWASSGWTRSADGWRL
jgi:NAD(P)-dependent dehydrogenase (short-subunit alcohol dehydrogenase family)